MSESKAVRAVKWPMVVGGVVLALIVAVGICEALGWPFLVSPMQHLLAKTLDRRVSFSPDASAPRVRIGLIGSLRLDAGYLEIGAPAWSQAPHMLLARDARLRLGYWDLWRAYKGDALRIRDLEARVLDGQLERTADGRASWQFGNKPPSTSPSEPMKIPTFGTLEVAQGTLGYHDAPLKMGLDAQFSLLERGGSKAADGSTGTAASAAPAAAASGAAGGVPPGLQFHGKGNYLALPFRVDVVTSGVLPVVGENASQIALPVSLDAVVGRAKMTFRGTATDALHMGGLKGSFSVDGPSLAALGDPLRVTLPTTGHFDAEGVVAKTGVVWNVVLNRMGVGASRLDGAFTYDPRPAVPLLSGRLSGSLALADLGPAVGGKPSPPASAAAKKDATPKKKGAKVLPDHEFDLPSLRAMNANVLIDIADLDLGSSVLEPLKPLRTHLVLDGGVLSLNDIDARTAQGRLGGRIQLDGRNTQRARWDADLRLDDVRLQSWIHQDRGRDQPPYLTGNLDGRVRLEGEGKSTAAILGSLKGGLRFDVVGGSVSHLGVEAAGLDVAQALGEFIKGDDALPMQCAVADFVAERGTLRPRVVVVDTSDSVVWVDGSLSLATEALDLRLLVSPKDFSPLALRTPVHVKGTFGDPSVSLEMGKLGGRVGAAALLAFVNPLAAVIPFFDTGSRDDAKRGATSCQSLLKRIAAHPDLAAPGSTNSAPAARKATVAATAPVSVPHPKPTGTPPPLVRLGPPSTR